MKAYPLLKGDKGDTGAQGIQGIQGNDGADGADGAQGIQGIQGVAGNDGADGSNGVNGLSAYEVWLGEGNSGTEQDFLDSLEGAQGIQGIQGVQGDTGAQGIQGIQGVAGNDGADGAQGIQGVDGLSAYEVAVNGGFIGDETAWLASLVGADGADGAQGIQGDTGAQGIQGIQGDAGLDGADGAQGIQGEQGIQGIQGVAGNDGADGADGANGAGLAIGGAVGDLIRKASTTDYDTEWFTPSDAYTYFPIWAEESGALGAGATEWSFGNGDETPLTSGIPLGVACELFAVGGEVENGVGIIIEAIKNGVSVAETTTFSTKNITVLGSPVSYAVGDLLNFRTKAVTSSSSGRPVAWFRVAVTGEKGDTGADGLAGADGDMTWEGAWSAGTYLLNQVVENNGSSYVCISASTTQEPPDTDWELVASKGEQGASGSTAPYGHFIISTAQNMGGANGTVHYVDWDGTPINKDTGFTHSTATNPSRIQVDADGRYEIKANVSVTQGGSARTTYMSGLRVNGTTANVRGRQRNYSRGSGYGDTSTGLNTEIDLSNGDYIEMSMTIDDSDATYTSNTINAECEFIIRKIA